MFNSLFEKLLGACRDIGVEFKSVSVDGKWHRANVKSNSPGKGDASIKIFPDGKGGIVKNWKSGEQRVVFDDQSSKTKLTTKSGAGNDVVSIKTQSEMANDAYLEAAKKANKLWNISEPASMDHPYLIKKKIGPHGIRQYKEALIVPIYVDGEIVSLQFISPDGSKRFLKGGRTKGGYFMIKEKNDE
jgi:putative DNA primase/helicase